MANENDVLESPPDLLISTAEFAGLIRSGDEDRDAYLEEVSTTVDIEGASTKVSFYRITHDATLNAPAVKKFVGKLVGLLVDFASTREERARPLLTHTETFKKGLLQQMFV